MPIISFKLNGDATLSSKANHLVKGKKLTMNFLVVCSLNIVFQVLAAADMINVNPSQAPSSRRQFLILIGNILLNALTLEPKLKNVRAL